MLQTQGITCNLNGTITKGLQYVYIHLKIPNFFFLIDDSSSPSLANGTRVEISSTMGRAKAWITVVSYLSPHLQPVVSLSEDVVKPSQTLKHPVASPCLNSPQPPLQHHAFPSPLWQFTLSWGLRHCRQFTEPRDTWMYSRKCEIADLYDLLAVTIILKYT